MLSVSEVSRRLSVSRPTVCRLAAAGLIPAVRVGGQWRFDHDELDAWLASEHDERDQGGRDE